MFLVIYNEYIRISMNFKVLIVIFQSYGDFYPIFMNFFVIFSELMIFNILIAKYIWLVM